jgi:CRP-like cAMP-binding protein
MQFTQADILGGLDKKFIARIMDLGVKSTHEKGEVLFKEGKSAQFFYLLIKGGVRLSIGDRAVYTATHGGEALGWSALAGRYIYTATATCLAPSVLIAFHRDDLEAIMLEDPVNAALFYKNLSLTLGNRLIGVLSHLADYLAVEDNISYGTGQVQEPAEAV